MSGTTTSPNTTSAAHLSKRRRRRQVDAETVVPDFFLTLGRHAVGFNQTRAEDDEKGYEAFNVNYPWFWQSIPSKQEVCLYSNLPVDLVRSIFEMAMWEPPPPCHLLLVSREIKSWVEPLLYLHIYIRDNKAMNLLYRTFRERWMPGRKSKSIPIDNSPLLKETQSIVICSQRAMHHDMLQEMTNLESLENWTTHASIVRLLQRDSSANRRIQEPPELDGPYFKKLRHLGFDGHLPQWEPTHTFAHQVFRDITHLDVYFFNHDRWMSIRHLQNLTHLCIDMVHNPDGFRSSDLSRIIEMIPVLPPSLTVFVLGCIGERNRDYDLTDFKRNDNPEDIRLPSSLVIQSNDYRQIHADNLSLLSQLTLGKVDPRIVVASTERLPENHTFRHCLVYLVYFTYRVFPRHWFGWEYESGPYMRRCGHAGTVWHDAEAILRRRIV